MSKDKLTKVMLVISGAIIGLGAGIVGIVNAQNVQTIPTSTVTSSTTAPLTQKPHGHAPLGGDGVISSINGTTIVMTEEADEGGASYTVDASGATFMTNGSAGTISDLKVGDKIFVQGPVNGTNVTATSVSLGHFGHMGGKRGNDNDADDQPGATGTTPTSQ